MSIQSMKAKFKELKRKDFAIAGLILAVIVLFVQKSNLQDEFDQMESHYSWEIEQLESKLEAKQNYIEQVNSGIGGVSLRVDDFEYEDWRDVVPDVYHAVKELERNIEEDPE